MARKGEFKQLAMLSAEQMSEVRRRLEDGEKTDALATLIQDQWGLCLDIKQPSLRKALDRYKDATLRRHAQDAVAKQLRAMNNARVVQTVHAMGELQEAVIIQKDRLMKAYGQEQKGPLLLDMVSKEMRLFKDMLSDLGKMQLETGLLPRAPKVVTGTVTDSSGNVTQFSWAEEDDQLAQRILSEASDGQMSTSLGEEAADERGNGL